MSAADAPDWLADALCAQVDSDVFHPEKGEGGKVRSAKRICAGCDVREQCLEWALARPSTFGIYGGLTYVERRKLAKQRAETGEAPAPEPELCRNKLHPMTPENTVDINGKRDRGTRRCRACRDAANRRAYLNRKKTAA